MNEFWLIFGMMIVTFGVRYPVLALLSKVSMPKIILNGLKYVPLAVLTAIIIPEVLLPDGQFDLTLNNAPLFAGLTAAIISWKTKNLLATIVFGMLALWGWRWMINFF